MDEVGDTARRISCSIAAGRTGYNLLSTPVGKLTSKDKKEKGGNEISRGKLTNNE